MITLDIIEGPNYRKDEDGWAHFAYTLKLSHEGRWIQIPWRQGVGITDEPELAGVLETLYGDASTVENATTFEEWAEDLGYDSDSRKAEAVYSAVIEQTNRLKGLLGEQYESLRSGLEV